MPGAVECRAGGRGKCLSQEYSTCIEYDERPHFLARADCFLLPVIPKTGDRYWMKMHSSIWNRLDSLSTN